MKTKETKQDEAITRQEEREMRSNQEQLVVLDKRLGKDIGAKKERVKLKKKK